MPRTALLIALLLSSTAFARPKAPTPDPSPAPAPAVDPATTQPPLLAETDDITHQVIALRGLSLKYPFARGVLGRDAIGAKLRERIDKEFTPDELELEARVLKRLGLLPQDIDYRKLLNDVLTEQVAGFYDPFARQLYVADWLDADKQRPALAHEIEHAIEDQHFDLKTFATPIKDDGDKQLARSALVEGDGTAVMLDFIIQSMGLDPSQSADAFASLSETLVKAQTAAAAAETPKFAAAPAYVRSILMFPYFSGLKFVAQLRKKGGWPAVDNAFKHPPDSTEQVLHVDKFLAREKPIPVAAAPLSSLGPAKPLHDDVVGELGFRLLLATRLDEDVAERAAAGWGGDRMAAYGAAAGPVELVSLSTWDSDDDAVEAETALREMFAKAHALPLPAADAPAVFTVGSEAFSVERKGRDVLALWGVPWTNRSAISDEVWKKWKVGGKRVE